MLKRRVRRGSGSAGISTRRQRCAKCVRAPGYRQTRGTIWSATATSGMRTGKPRPFGALQRSWAEGDNLDIHALLPAYEKSQRASGSKMTLRPLYVLLGAAAVSFLSHAGEE